MDLSPTVSPTRTLLPLMAVMSIMMFASGCNQDTHVLPENASLPAPSHRSSSACIDVTGTVGGDLIPYSTVFLYRTANDNYSKVMECIRKTHPVAGAVVNESRQFLFPCLAPGSYAFVIPTPFYQGSMGFPLPYEFDCQNFSLRVSFQGGDSEYAVGAFSLMGGPTHEGVYNSSGPPIPTSSRGTLYRDCHYLGLS
jgi:hypothetical protein